MVCLYLYNNRKGGMVAPFSAIGLALLTHFAVSCSLGQFLTNQLIPVNNEENIAKASFSILQLQKIFIILACYSVSQVF